MLCWSCLRAKSGVPKPAIRSAVRAKKSLPVATRRAFLSTSCLSSPHTRPLRSSKETSSTSISPLYRITPPLETRTYSTTAQPQAAGPAAAHESGAGLQKPEFLDNAESVVWDRLVAEFTPTELLVQDISGGCGSMYGIEIASEKFRGVNMLKQQRMVNAVLGDLLKGWHGVQLKTRVP